MSGHVHPEPIRAPIGRRAMRRWLALAAFAAAAAPCAAVAVEGGPGPIRLAQAGPLVLPGAVPDSGAPPPAPGAQPSHPERRKTAPSATAQPKRPAAARAAPARAPAPAEAAPPAPVAATPPAPTPQALPGFEHLAPPPPPPAPVAGESAKPTRTKAAGKRTPATAAPAEATALPADAGPPMADDVPAQAAAPRPVLLPSAATGSFQPMSLSDVSLLTRRRLLLADAPPLAGDKQAGGRAVRTAMVGTTAPLYAPMSFVLGTERVYDPQLSPMDAVGSLPLALNSVEALREGVPVGPFRAGLIEENPGGSPRIETGTAIWQVEGDPATTAEHGPTAIKAIATIGKGPARVTLTLRNEPAADGSGPLSMDLNVDMPGDAVVQAGVPEMRNSGIDRGVALYAAVSGDPSHIRFAFAGNQSDGEQNVRMLAQRSWLDVPVRLRSGRKVVFAIEKGTAVRDMMREAFRLWRLPWLP
jgi:hypothetical protein